MRTWKIKVAHDLTILKFQDYSVYQHSWSQAPRWRRVVLLASQRQNSTLFMEMKHSRTSLLLFLYSVYHNYLHKWSKIRRKQKNIRSWWDLQCLLGKWEVHGHTGSRWIHRVVAVRRVRCVRIQNYKHHLSQPTQICLIYTKLPLLLHYMCCKSPNPICGLSSRWLARNFITTQLFQDVYCTTAKLYLEQERQNSCTEG